MVRSLLPAPAPAPSLCFRDAALLEAVEEYVHSIPVVREIVVVSRCDDFLAKTKAGACPSEEIMGGLTSLCVSSVVLT
jgi:hypothetical protein